MRQNGVAADQLSRLWRRHAHSEFPARLEGLELAGVDLARLASEVSECVASYLTSKGALDQAQQQLLVSSVDDLDAVLPLLATRTESLYFSRLRQLSTMILELQ